MELHHLLSLGFDRVQGGGRITSFTVIPITVASVPDCRQARKAQLIAEVAAPSPQGPQGSGSTMQGGGDDPGGDGSGGISFFHEHVNAMVYNSYLSSTIIEIEQAERDFAYYLQSRKQAAADAGPPGRALVQCIRSLPQNYTMLFSLLHYYNTQSHAASDEGGQEERPFGAEVGLHRALPQLPTTLQQHGHAMFLLPRDRYLSYVYYGLCDGTIAQVAIVVALGCPEGLGLQTAGILAIDEKNVKLSRALASQGDREKELLAALKVTPSALLPSSLALCGETRTGIDNNQDGGLETVAAEAQRVSRKPELPAGASSTLPMPYSYALAPYRYVIKYNEEVARRVILHEAGEGTGITFLAVVLPTYAAQRAAAMEGGLRLYLDYAKDKGRAEGDRGAESHAPSPDDQEDSTGATLHGTIGSTICLGYPYEEPPLPSTEPLEAYNHKILAVRGGIITLLEPFSLSAVVPPGTLNKTMFSHLKFLQDVRVCCLQTPLPSSVKGNRLVTQELSRSDDRLFRNGTSDGPHGADKSNLYYPLCGRFAAIVKQRYIVCVSFTDRSSEPYHNSGRELTMDTVIPSLHKGGAKRKSSPYAVLDSDNEYDSHDDSPDSATGSDPIQQLMIAPENATQLVWHYNTIIAGNGKSYYVYDARTGAKIEEFEIEAEKSSQSSINPLDRLTNRLTGAQEGRLLVFPLLKSLPPSFHPSHLAGWSCGGAGHMNRLSHGGFGAGGRPSSPLRIYATGSMPLTGDPSTSAAQAGTTTVYLPAAPDGGSLLLRQPYPSFYPGQHGKPPLLKTAKPVPLVGMGREGSINRNYYYDVDYMSPLMIGFHGQAAWIQQLGVTVTNNIHLFANRGPKRATQQVFGNDINNSVISSAGYYAVIGRVRDVSSQLDVPTIIKTINLGLRGAGAGSPVTSPLRGNADGKGFPSSKGPAPAAGALNRPPLSINIRRTLLLLLRQRLFYHQNRAARHSSCSGQLYHYDNNFYYMTRLGANSVVKRSPAFYFSSYHYFQKSARENIFCYPTSHIISAAIRYGPGFDTERQIQFDDAFIKAYLKYYLAQLNLQQSGRGPRKRDLMLLRSSARQGANAPDAGQKGVEGDADEDDNGPDAFLGIRIPGYINPNYAVETDGRALSTKTIGEAGAGSIDCHPVHFLLTASSCGAEGGNKVVANYAFKHIGGGLAESDTIPIYDVNQSDRLNALRYHPQLPLTLELPSQFQVQTNAFLLPFHPLTGGAWAPLVANIAPVGPTNYNLPWNRHSNRAATNDNGATEPEKEEIDDYVADIKAIVEEDPATTRPAATASPGDAGDASGSNDESYEKVIDSFYLMTQSHNQAFYNNMLNYTPPRFQHLPFDLLNRSLRPYYSRPMIQGDHDVQRAQQPLPAHLDGSIVHYQRVPSLLSGCSSAPLLSVMLLRPSTAPELAHFEASSRQTHHQLKSMVRRTKLRWQNGAGRTLALRKHGAEYWDEDSCFDYAMGVSTLSEEDSYRDDGEEDDEHGQDAGKTGGAAEQADQPDQAPSVTNQQMAGTAAPVASRDLFLTLPLPPVTLLLQCVMSGAYLNAFSIYDAAFSSHHSSSFGLGERTSNQFNLSTFLLGGLRGSSTLSTAPLTSKRLAWKCALNPVPRPSLVTVESIMLRISDLLYQTGPFCQSMPTATPAVQVDFTHLVRSIERSQCRHLLSPSGKVNSGLVAALQAATGSTQLDGSKEGHSALNPPACPSLLFPYLAKFAGRGHIPGLPQLPFLPAASPAAAPGTSSNERSSPRGAPERERGDNVGAVLPHWALSHTQRYDLGRAYILLLAGVIAWRRSDYFTALLFFNYCLPDPDAVAPAHRTNAGGPNPPSSPIDWLGTVLTACDIVAGVEGLCRPHVLRGFRRPGNDGSGAGADVGTSIKGMSLEARLEALEEEALADVEGEDDVSGEEKGAPEGLNDMPSDDERFFKRAHSLMAEAAARHCYEASSGLLPLVTLEQLNSASSGSAASNTEKRDCVSLLLLLLLKLRKIVIEKVKQARQVYKNALKNYTWYVAQQEQEAEEPLNSDSRSTPTGRGGNYLDPSTGARPSQGRIPTVTFNLDTNDNVGRSSYSSMKSPRGTVMSPRSRSENYSPSAAGLDKRQRRLLKPVWTVMLRPLQEEAKAIDYALFVLLLIYTCPKQNFTQNDIAAVAAASVDTSSTTRRSPFGMSGIEKNAMINYFMAGMQGGSGVPGSTTSAAAEKDHQTQPDGIIHSLFFPRCAIDYDEASTALHFYCKGVNRGVRLIQLKLIALFVQQKCEYFALAQQRDGVRKTLCDLLASSASGSRTVSGAASPPPVSSSANASPSTTPTPATTPNLSAVATEQRDAAAPNDAAAIMPIINATRKRLNAIEQRLHWYQANLLSIVLTLNNVVMHLVPAMTRHVGKFRALLLSMKGRYARALSLCRQYSLCSEAIVPLQLSCFRFTCSRVGSEGTPGEQADDDYNQGDEQLSSLKRRAERDSLLARRRRQLEKGFVFDDAPAQESSENETPSETSSAYLQSETASGTSSSDFDNCSSFLMHTFSRVENAESPDYSLENDYTKDPVYQRRANRQRDLEKLRCEIEKEEIMTLQSSIKATYSKLCSADTAGGGTADNTTGSTPGLDEQDLTLIAIYRNSLALMNRALLNPAYTSEGDELEDNRSVSLFGAHLPWILALSTNTAMKLLTFDYRSINGSNEDDDEDGDILGSLFVDGPETHAVESDDGPAYYSASSIPSSSYEFNAMGASRRQKGLGRRRRYVAPPTALIIKILLRSGCRGIPLFIYLHHLIHNNPDDEYYTFKRSEVNTMHILNMVDMVGLLLRAVLPRQAGPDAALLYRCLSSKKGAGATVFTAADEELLLPAGGETGLLGLLRSYLLFFLQAPHYSYDSDAVMARLRRCIARGWWLSPGSPGAEEIKALDAQEPVLQATMLPEQVAVLLKRNDDLLAFGLLVYGLNALPLAREYCLLLQDSQNHLEAMSRTRHGTTGADGHGMSSNCARLLEVLQQMSDMNSPADGGDQQLGRSDPFKTLHGGLGRNPSPDAAVTRPVLLFDNDTLTASKFFMKRYSNQARLDDMVDQESSESSDDEGVAETMPETVAEALDTGRQGSHRRSAAAPSRPSRLQIVLFDYLSNTISTIVGTRAAASGGSGAKPLSMLLAAGPPTRGVFAYPQHYFGGASVSSLLSCVGDYYFTNYFNALRRDMSSSPTGSPFRTDASLASYNSINYYYNENSSNVGVRHITDLVDTLDEERSAGSGRWGAPGIGSGTAVNPSPADQLANAANASSPLMRRDYHFNYYLSLLIFVLLFPPSQWLIFGGLLMDDDDEPAATPPAKGSGKRPAAPATPALAPLYSQRPARRLESALELLETHNDVIDPMFLLRILPGDVPLARLRPFLLRSLQIGHTRRQMLLLLVKTARASVREAAARALLLKTRRFVYIDQARCCPVCQLPVADAQPLYDGVRRGENSNDNDGRAGPEGITVFVALPDLQVVHYRCLHRHFPQSAKNEAGSSNSTSINNNMNTNLNNIVNENRDHEPVRMVPYTADF